MGYGRSQLRVRPNPSLEPTSASMALADQLKRQVSPMRRGKVEKLVQSLTSWEEGLARLGECIVQFQRIEDGLSVWCLSASSS